MQNLKITLKDDPIGEDLGIFDVSKFTLDDAFTLENATGLTINQMIRGIDDRYPKCIQALVWFMKFKRGDGTHLSAIPNFNIVTDLSVELVDPTVASSENSVTSTSDSSPTSAT